VQCSATRHVVLKLKNVGTTAQRTRQCRRWSSRSGWLH
jgi:hypothetical protein